MTLGEAGIAGALVTVCLEDRIQRRQQGENVAVESCVASEAVMPCLPAKLVQASAGLDVAVSQQWVEHGVALYAMGGYPHGDQRVETATRVGWQLRSEGLQHAARR